MTERHIAGHAQVVGILLAAGAGRRFGSDKLLHPLADGSALAVAAAKKILSACDLTLAVIRPDNERLHRLLTAEGLLVVTAPESECGMGHSLAAGIRAASDACAWVVALADMPYIDPASYRRVADELRTGGSIVVPEFKGQRGHPVGFDRKWYGQLIALSGDKGASSILASFPEEMVRCDVDDPGILRDVDTVADLAVRNDRSPS